jgi:hypothetical protein
VHELRILVLSYHPLITIETAEEDRVENLLRSVASDLRVPLMTWSLTDGLRRWGEQNPIYGTSEPDKALAAVDQISVNAIFWMKDLAPHLRDPAMARRLRDIAERFATNHGISTVVLTGASLDLPPDVEAVAVPFELRLPSLAEYREVIQSMIQSLAVRGGAPVDTNVDLVELSRALSGMTLNQARQAIAYTALSDGKLTPHDIDAVVALKAKTIKEGGLLEFFPAEDNQHELGGFSRLKAWLESARQGFSEQAKSLNLDPPKGILIVGVQGCGKSLAAKVIARQWRLPLLKLDAGRLYDSLVGQSEKNFRRAAAMAEAMSPVVLWIDEIEKGFAPTRGDADAGLSQRIFGAFLTWLQDKDPGVFVVATANDISRLPPELVRKGRFDEIFFVDLPTESERAEIWRIHLRIRRQNPDSFDIPALVAATEGFSGAEIEQAVIAALYNCLQANHPLDTNELLASVKNTVPLSASRREDIAGLRAYARDRFVAVN